MPDLVKLATARVLVDAGAIKGAEVIGLAGGWTLQLQTHAQPKLLATKEGEPRRFSSFEGALKVLRDLGVRTDALRVDAAHWDTIGEQPARRRPDRSTAMKLKDEDARYVAFLRTSVEEARADPRPSLSSGEAADTMARQRELRRARLSAKLGVEIAMPDSRDQGEAK